MSKYPVHTRNLAHYAAARAVADWLCGGTPQLIRLTPGFPWFVNLKSAAGFTEDVIVKTGTHLQPVGRKDLLFRGLTRMRNFVMNQLFIVNAGVMTLEHPAYSDQVSVSDDFLAHADQILTDRLMSPFVLTRRRRKWISACAIDATYCVMSHDDVRAAVRDLADSLLKRDIITNDNNELEEFVHDRLIHLRVAPGTTFLTWPTPNRPAFLHKLWAELMPTWGKFGAS